jgi:hypothetical protein
MWGRTTSLAAMVAVVCALSSRFRKVSDASALGSGQAYPISLQVASGEDCILVEDSRYLLNSGGFQIGHWGMAFAQIVGALEQLDGHKSAVQLDGHQSPVRLIFYDRIRSDQMHRQLSEVIRVSEYLNVTLRVLGEAAGVSFLKVFDDFDAVKQTCDPSRLLRVSAAESVQDDSWFGNTAATLADNVVKVFHCDTERTDDVLIYNRRGTRRVANVAALLDYLGKAGLVSKVLTPNELTPIEQLCEMTRERKFIITPHGGQQGSLLFKRVGVSVVVLSPEKALLECYRYFARLSDQWFAVRGDKAWSCSSTACSRDSDAWYDPTCDKACVVQARGQLIEGSLTALAKVVNMSIAWK